MAAKILQVSGMMCGNCQQHVQDILTAVKGVSNVNVSLENGEAQLEIDQSNFDKGDLQEAFKDTSYSVVF
tara:strand:+ start:514 stop:723 length:210 start_codon:yes stop_codon:yes gene_type:complete